MFKCEHCNSKCIAGQMPQSILDNLKKHISRVNFKKGDFIFKEGELSQKVAFLKCGIVKLHMHGPVKEKILRIVKAPTYIGLPTSISNNINNFSATAIIDTSVCFIDTEQFREFIYNNGKIAFQIMIEMSENELMDYQRYTNQSQKQIPGMIAETILCLSDRIFNEENRFIFPLSQSELADLVGTSRESVSRILSDFSQNKIITFNGKELNILKREMLEEISAKG
jgi:CRP-like cAMP-binding protein